MKGPRFSFRQQARGTNRQLRGHKPTMAQVVQSNTFEKCQIYTQRKTFGLYPLAGQLEATFTKTEDEDSNWGFSYPIICQRLTLSVYKFIVLRILLNFPMNPHLPLQRNTLTFHFIPALFLPS